MIEIIVEKTYPQFCLVVIVILSTVLRKRVIMKLDYCNLTLTPNVKQSFTEKLKVAETVMTTMIF